MVNGTSWDSVSPVASVTRPNTTVTGNSRGKIVTVDIEITNGVGTIEGAASIIAVLKEGCRPAHTYNCLIGTGGGVGAWLMLSINPSGNVGVYHLYFNGNLSWATVYASVTFVAA